MCVSVFVCVRVCFERGLFCKCLESDCLRGLLVIVVRFKSFLLWFEKVCFLFFVVCLSSKELANYKGI